MTISRMQQPRQQYGLGSFVKKIGKKIKKVAKSPLGKAAMLYFAPMALGKSAGLGGYKSLFSNMGNSLFTPKVPDLIGKKGLLEKLKLVKSGGEISGLGKMAAIGIPSIIAGMGADKEDEIDSNLNNDKRQAELKRYLRYYFGNMNPNAKQSEIDEFVDIN